MKAAALDGIAQKYHVGDAVYKASSAPNSHPLSPDSGLLFDRVFALDCAYHFDSRRQFLAQVFAHLTPNGRVGLADICFSRSNTVSRILLSGVIPIANNVTVSMYKEQLYELGFDKVEIDDVSEAVFPGFIAFLKSRGRLWWVFGHVMGILYYRAGARFIIATAEKPL